MNCSFKIDFKKLGLFGLSMLSLALAVLCNFYFASYAVEQLVSSIAYGPGNAVGSGSMILFAFLFAGFLVCFIYFVHKLNHYTGTNNTCCCVKKKEVKEEVAEKPVQEKTSEKPAAPTETVSEQ